MKYSKNGTLCDLRRCGEYWVVVSFYTPLFGKEVGKGSEAAMKTFYELLTKDGRDALGFEYNGAQVVMPKIEMFVDDKLETSGLLGGLAIGGIHAEYTQHSTLGRRTANQPCESMFPRGTDKTVSQGFFAGCGGFHVSDKTSQRVGGLLSLLRAYDKRFFGADTEKEKDRTGYSRKSKIPSQTKPSCELGKAQKDFLSRLKLSGEKA